MFASRGFRFSALLIALITALSLVTVDTAEARRGGSFGSRGMRTFQTVPATPTAPTITAPVQRSMTNSTTPANRAATAATAQRPGWFGGMFGGLGGMLLGGLLFSGLFGLLFGAGFGGFGGFISLIFQVLIVGLLLSWLLGRFRRPAPAGYASPYAGGPPPGWPLGNAGGTRASGPGSAASQRAGRRDELGLGQSDLDMFERRLTELQSAYANEDYDALRRITTPEMMSYLAEELGTNARNGVRNEVYDVRLLSGDIAEAWREGNEQYATVALRYESRDITRERATGRIVSGDDRVTPMTEVWTFVRQNGGPWLVSAIQET
jgi:predicted lipid-binding transport protein (Tim44 family)